DTRYYALELIQTSAKAAWAQLDFHRLAFGASASLGADVPLQHVEQVARRYVENGKRRLHWQADGREISKPYARLLLGMIALSLPAIPAGGDIHVGISGLAPDGEKKEQDIIFAILCRGRVARVPDRMEDILAGRNLDDIDSRHVLP